MTILTHDHIFHPGIIFDSDGSDDFIRIFEILLETKNDLLLENFNFNTKNNILGHLFATIKKAY